MSDSLASLVASLSIQDDVRKSKRLKMPDASLVDEFERLACLMMNRKFGGSSKLRNRRIKAKFGAPPLVLAKCWELIIEDPMHDKIQKQHFMWAMNLLKEYPPEANASSRCTVDGKSVDEKTYRKWAWRLIEELALLTPDVVSFELLFIVNLT